ncbi:MAG: hypothetical protein ACE5I7_01000 [Candidatus Binatia bacterium]
MLPQLLQLLDRAVAGVGVARRVLAFWGPVMDMPALLGSLFAVASVLTLALLSGVAVAALATLLVALMVLYLLLTQVFGVTVDVQSA